VTLHVNRDRISSRAWGDVDNTAIRQRLVKGLHDSEGGAASAVREVYAVVTGSGPLDENPSGRWWGPHHEVTSDGEVVLNRAGLGAAAAALAGGRADPNLSSQEQARATRHLSQHYVENDLPLPEGFQGRTGEMHILGGVIGEMSAGDIPLSSSFTEVERTALLKGDDDPMEVVIEVAPGKSTRGWNYTPQALQKMVDHVQSKTLAGIKGHQRDENLPHEFVDPATHWIGAVWRDDKAYFRGLIDKNAPDLKRWIRAKRITQPSIYSRPTIERVNGETRVVDLEPLGIDWAPLDRAGMNTARVVAWGEMDAIGGDPASLDRSTPPEGDHDDIRPKEKPTVATTRESIDNLREQGATPSQVIQGMNWRAADILPVMIASDRRGVAEALDTSTLQHVAAGEMAKAHQPRELLTGIGLDLAAIAPLVDDAQWQRLQANDKAVGEMRVALGLPESADAAAVRAKVAELQTSLTTSAQDHLRSSVEGIVARGEMAVAAPVRPMVTRVALLELQPGADEAAIKAAVVKAKASDEIKPILEAGFSSTVIRTSQNGAAGEMNGTSNGSAPTLEVGLPMRRRSI
jgi:hypothetical protein